MPSESIIAAALSGVVTVIGVLIANSKSQAVTDTRLEELTREVRAHNNFAQRVPVLDENAKLPTTASRTWNRPPNGSEYNSKKKHRR